MNASALEASPIFTHRPTIAREAFTRELFEELLPLARKCWAEATFIKGKSCAYYGERDFEIDPDFEAYQRLEASGALVLIVLRDQGIVKGYAEGFTYRTLHHARIVGAIGDSIYLEPEYRSHTIVVIDKFVQEMRAQGAKIIGWPTHPDGPIYQLLRAMGFLSDDVVMEKRL